MEAADFTVGYPDADMRGPGSPAPSLSDLCAPVDEMLADWLRPAKRVRRTGDGGNDHRPEGVGPGQSSSPPLSESPLADLAALEALVSMSQHQHQHRGVVDPVPPMVVAGRGGASEPWPLMPAQQLRLVEKEKGVTAVGAPCYWGIKRIGRHRKDHVDLGGRLAPAMEAALQGYAIEAVMARVPTDADRMQLLQSATDEAMAYLLRLAGERPDTPVPMVSETAAGYRAWRERAMGVMRPVLVRRIVSDWRPTCLVHPRLVPPTFSGRPCFDQTLAAENRPFRHLRRWFAARTPETPEEEYKLSQLAVDVLNDMLCEAILSWADTELMQKAIAVSVAASEPVLWAYAAMLRESLQFDVVGKRAAMVLSEYRPEHSDSLMRRWHAFARIVGGGDAVDPDWRRTLWRLVLKHVDLTLVPAEIIALAPSIPKWAGTKPVCHAAQEFALLRFTANRERRRRGTKKQTSGDSPTSSTRSSSASPRSECG